MTGRRDAGTSSILSTEHVVDSDSSADETRDQRTLKKTLTIERKRKAPSPSSNSDGSDSESSNAIRANGATGKAVDEATTDETSDGTSEDTLESEGEDSSDSLSADDGREVLKSSDNGRPPKKAKPSTTPGVVPVPGKRFSPPAGFQDVSLSAVDYANRAPAFLSQHSGKELWYFTAPSSVPLDSLEKIDLRGVMSGQSTLVHGDTEYAFISDARKHESLLLPQNERLEYVKEPTTFTRVFHLKASKPVNPRAPLSTSKASALNFTADATQTPKPPREQPKGLQMRYMPFGSGRVASGYVGTPSRPREEGRAFEMPDDIVTGAPNRSKHKKSKIVKLDADEPAAIELVEKPDLGAKQLGNPTETVDSVQNLSAAQSGSQEKKKKKKKKSRLVEGEAV